jgi:subtilisin family serine protease
MSLGGGPSTALDQAVVAAAATGVKFTLAAGNESESATRHSPARANGPNVYTVSSFAKGTSATDTVDPWSSFSNFGNPPVDYAEPGSSIPSTYKNGSYATLSGTSMAAPHLAGILLAGNVQSNSTVDGDPDGNPDPIGTK